MLGESHRELLQLVGSPIQEVVDAAQRAIELKNLLMENSISRREYEELYTDITRLDRIDSAMLTEDVYLKIRQAYIVIMTLKSIASII
jgi:hypothetical protein